MVHQSNFHAPKVLSTTRESTDATGLICCQRLAMRKLSSASNAQRRLIHIRQPLASCHSRALPFPATRTASSSATKVNQDWLHAAKTKSSIRALWHARMPNKQIFKPDLFLLFLSVQLICKLFFDYKFHLKLMRNFKLLCYSCWNRFFLNNKKYCFCEYFYPNISGLVTYCRTIFFDLCCLLILFQGSFKLLDQEINTARDLESRLASRCR